MKKKVITALGLIFMVISILWLVSFAATNSEAYIPSETSTETEEVMTLNEQGLPIAGVETVFAMQRTATLEEKQPEIIKLETKYFERIESTSKEELEKELERCERRMKAANLILEGCEMIGYEENHPVVDLANREYSNAEEDYNYYKPIYDEIVEQEAWLRRAEEYPAATEVWLYCKNVLGYNDYVIAGIMGNLMSEVGGQTLNLDYTAQNNSYYGMCQWKKATYSEIVGADLNIQCEFLGSTIEYEFDTFGKAYASNFDYEAFLALDDERAAALAFAKCYERCGSGSYKVRQNNAEFAYEYFTTY